MADVLLHRLLETAAMLPILHAPAGPITVAAVGPMAEALAGEALKWRDTQRVITLQPVAIRDRRLEVSPTLPAAGCQVILLSPEQQPGPWWAALAPDGIVSASTCDRTAWPRLLDDIRRQLGRVTPWRDYLPRPFYGGLGRNGSAKAERTRLPPRGAQHLSEQFLPVLFTFSRDELPVAFTRPTVRLANQPGTGYDLVQQSASPARPVQLSFAGKSVPAATGQSCSPGP